VLSLNNGRQEHKRKKGKKEAVKKGNGNKKTRKE
jgi:hypothetical protein